MFYSFIPQPKQETSFMHGTHRTALEAKHASLDSRLADEQGRPSPDQGVIADLKKRKLRVKEEIVSA